MGKLFEHSVATRRLIVNARQLPEHEYNKLYNFSTPTIAKYGVQASIYDSGVVVYVEGMNGVRMANIKAAYDMPVFRSILEDIWGDGISIIDFDEDYTGTATDNLMTLYEWEEKL